MDLKSITRTEYLSNSSELFDAYWRQFVTGQTIRFVKSSIGVEKLRASTCKHLNDVVKWQNGGCLWLWDYSPINTELLKELGESDCPSTRTNVGKAAARIILESVKNDTVLVNR
jgi:hypothetical protein